MGLHGALLGYGRGMARVRMRVDMLDIVSVDNCWQFLHYIVVALS